MPTDSEPEGFYNQANLKKQNPNHKDHHRIHTSKVRTLGSPLDVPPRWYKGPWSVVVPQVHPFSAPLRSELIYPRLFSVYHQALPVVMTGLCRFEYGFSP